MKSNFFIGKKAQELSFRKIISLIILLIVIVIIIYGIANNIGILTNKDKGLSKIFLESKIQKCDLGLCEIYKCEEKLDCTPKEYEEWQGYLLYIKACDEKEIDEDEKNDCKGNSLYDEIIKVRDGVEIGGTTIDKQSISNFLSSPFYSTNKNKFESTAAFKGIDVNVLYAIIIKEGGYNLAFNRSVRFECHKFNQIETSNKMKCTIGPGGFSSVPTETNYNAYKEAYKINKEAAILSSSSGFAQLLGESYKEYNFIFDYEKGIEQVEDSNIQIEYFFKFIEKKNNGELFSCIKIPDWECIAKNYNGGTYKVNNYDTHIKFAYTELTELTQVS